MTVSKSKKSKDKKSSKKSAKANAKAKAKAKGKAKDKKPKTKTAKPGANAEATAKATTPTAPATPKAATLDTVLSAAALKKLRSGYDAALVNILAQKAFEGPYVPAGALAKVIIDQFYQLAPAPGRLTGRDREVVLLARLAGEPGMNFKTHVYFGLMEGLTPVEILDITLCAALYGGADIWTGAAHAIGATFGVLATAAASNEPDAVSTLKVILALRG